jgi:hypothetical protein
MRGKHPERDIASPNEKKDEKDEGPRETRVVTRVVIGCHREKSAEAIRHSAGSRHQFQRTFRHEAERGGKSTETCE